MSAKQTRSKKAGNLTERGISPAKVAYLYGISIETLHKWLNENDEFDELMVANKCYPVDSRKWSPTELQFVFDFFGDPREYKEMIEPFERDDS